LPSNHRAALGFKIRAGWRGTIAVTAAIAAAHKRIPRETPMNEMSDTL